MVHCAGDVSFDPPVDEGFRNNVVGTRALLERVRQIGDHVHYVHVSTAYVAGRRRGFVPEAWVDFARMPLPDAPEYGAHWWVNGTSDDVPFPMMFSAQGFNGQLIFVIPELDTVIVVLSNDGTDLPDRVAWTLVDAFASLAE